MIFDLAAGVTEIPEETDSSMFCFILRTVTALPVKLSLDLVFDTARINALRQSKELIFSSRGILP